MRPLTTGIVAARSREVVSHVELPDPERVVRDDVVRPVDTELQVHPVPTRVTAFARPHQFELVLAFKQRARRIVLIEGDFQWRVIASLETRFAAGRQNDSKFMLGTGYIDVTKYALVLRVSVAPAGQVLERRFHDDIEHLTRIEQGRCNCGHREKYDSRADAE